MEGNHSTHLGSIGGRSDHIGPEDRIRDCSGCRQVILIYYLCRGGGEDKVLARAKNKQYTAVCNQIDFCFWPWTIAKKYLDLVVCVNKNNENFQWSKII